MFGVVLGTNIGTLVSYIRISKAVKLMKNTAIRSLVGSSNSTNSKSESNVAEATVMIVSSVVVYFAPGVCLTLAVVIILYRSCLTKRRWVLLVMVNRIAYPIMFYTYL